MSIFRQDSGYGNFMSVIGDLAMVNVAWLICCLPIVTIGASTGALYEVVRSLHEHDDAHVMRKFLRAFTRRFGASLALTLAWLAFVALAMFDLWFLSHQTRNMQMVSMVYGFVVAIIAVISVGGVFIFMVTSRSSLSVWSQIRQSFVVAIHHPLTAIIVFVLDALPIILLTLMPGGPFFVGFFWGLLLMACTAWVQIALMVRASIITLRPVGAPTR
ncbi:MAG: YesL family protein [Bifidobacterium sp.]|nr:YesL family protein [Bifidobacterium sp.]MCI1864906.1 YesL family protein [Bifidobacterium sp.]